jgi:hypothetical protein
MMKIKTKGMFRANHQIVRNELFQAAFDLVGALLTGTTGRFFRDLRILDESENVVATAIIEFDFDEAPDPPGVTIEGSVIFPANQVSSDIHHVQLRDSEQNVLAQATFPEAFPEGSALSVTRRDTFTAAPEE